MECEIYVLTDGRFQCGNCGNVTDEAPAVCQECGSVVTEVVDEGEADDSIWEE